MLRIWSVQTTAILAVLLPLLSTSTRSAAAGSDGPELIVGEFASALHRGDVTAGRALLVKPPAYGVDMYDRVLKRLADAAKQGRYRLRPLDSSAEGNCAVVAVEETDPSRRGAAADYDPVYLLKEDEGWRVLPGVSSFERPPHPMTPAQKDAYRRLARWFDRWEARRRLLDAGRDADDAAVEAALREKVRRDWSNAIDSPDKMRELLDRGADIEWRNEAGHTNLRAAINFGLTRSALFLIDAGADVEAKTCLFEKTPLMLAAETGDEKTVARLLEKKADVHARNKEGATALHGAGYAASVPAARLLLAAGAIPPQRTRTAKHHWIGRASAIRLTGRRRR